MRREMLGGLALALAMPLAAHAASYTLTLPCDALFHAFPAGGRYAAMLCKDGSVPILALPSGRKVMQLDRPQVAGFAFSADGRRLAIRRPDGRVSLFAMNGKPIKTFSAGKQAGGLRFLDDDHLVLGRTVWDIGTARPVRTLQTSFSGINALARSPDGTQLVAAGADTVVRFYNSASWKLTHRYTGLTLEPFTLAFTKGGREIALGGGNDRIVLLDAATGEAIRKLPRSGPDGVYIASIAPVGDHGWAAVEYVDFRTNKPVAWRYVDLASGTSRPACRGAAAMSVSGDTVWCFHIKGRTLTAKSETPPHG